MGMWDACVPHKTNQSHNRKDRKKRDERPEFWPAEKR